MSINARAILNEEKKLVTRALTGRALESLVDLLVVLAISFVWLPFAFILAVSVASVNAWVLTVEILR